MIQVNHSILENNYLSRGGSIHKDKQNRLFRSTKHSCYNSKMWDTVRLAQPDDVLTDKNPIARISNDGKSLFTKFNVKFIEKGVKRNLKIPLHNSDDYCVSTFGCSSVVTFWA